jgi:predicted PurR-regulated permease PerM
MGRRRATIARSRLIPREASPLTDDQPFIPASQADARAFPRITRPTRAAVVAAAGATIVLVLAYLVGEVLAMFVIGLIVAYLLDYPVTWLARHRVPRALGAILSIAVLGIVVFLFFILVFGAIVQQGADFIAEVPSAIDQLKAWYATANLAPEVRAVLDSFFAGIAEWAAGFNVATFVADIVAAVLGVVGSFFTLAAIPFFMFFVLKDRPGLVDATWGVFPAAWRADARAIGGSVVGSFGAYVRAESILMVLVGFITWAGLMLLSILVDPRIAEFALFLAVVAAICELIPNFGPILALIPALLFGLTLGPPAFVAILLLYLAIMFLEGQVLVPTIEGKQFQIHPAWVLVLILGGLALLGPLGAILALPVAAAGRDVFGYVFRRAAGLDPLPALAAPAAQAGDRPFPPPSSAAAPGAAGGDR